MQENAPINIEFVEFYPFEKKKTKKNGWVNIGTVHIYLIDYEMDIRGIVVIQKGKNFRFNCPHFMTYDPEEKRKVTYPHIRFTNEAKHKALMDFLHQKALKHVKEKLNFTNREVKLHDSGTKLEERG